MYFDEDFIKSLPEDVHSAIVEICTMFTNMQKKVSTDKDQYSLITEAYAFVAAYFEANGINMEIPKFQYLTTEDKSNAIEFFSMLQNQALQKVSQSEFEQYKNLFAARLGKGFYYEFSEGELNLIQNLINELRELISTNGELGEGHRHRLIKKLEKIKSELHKTISELDRFWGFYICLSIVIGLMGENAKPAEDLVKKIVDIIWTVQTRAYDLPSSLPFKLLGRS